MNTSTLHFSEARVHDPEKMALLCPGCHHKVTTKFWSKEKVGATRKSPICKKIGYSREFFDVGNGEPYLKFCGVTFQGNRIPIMIKEWTVFKIEPGESPGEPFRFSGFFTDSKGKVSLQIDQNEWKAKSSNWDVDVVGPSISIREGKGKIHLILVADPPNGIIVKRVNMVLEGCQLTGDENSLEIFRNDRYLAKFTGSMTGGGLVGIKIE